MGGGGALAGQALQGSGAVPERCATEVRDSLYGKGVVMEIRLLDRAVGRRCAVALLGMGSRRFRRALAGTPDLRCSLQECRAPRQRSKEAHADAFFTQLYITTAETFPTGCPGQGCQARDGVAGGWGGSGRKCMR